MRKPSEPIRFTHRGRAIVVTRNERHPDYYLWITVDGALFYLGSLTPRIRTRGDVKALALEWLKKRDEPKRPRRRAN